MSFTIGLPPDEHLPLGDNATYEILDGGVLKIVDGQVVRLQPPSQWLYVISNDGHGPRG
jgi:hypothetical protein